MSNPLQLRERTLMDRKTRIVADGQKRAYDGNVEQVRAEVEAKYAEELRRAGVWKRMQLRRKMEKEIRERMKKIAPSDGLY